MSADYAKAVWRLARHRRVQAYGEYESAMANLSAEETRFRVREEAEKDDIGWNAREDRRPRLRQLLEAATKERDHWSAVEDFVVETFLDGVKPSSGKPSQEGQAA